MNYPLAIRRSVSLTSRIFQISFTKCRKGDFTSIILPGDAVSVRYCHVRLCEDLLCCHVQQKLPRGGAFVSYPLAGGELERVAGAKYLRFFERLPVLITPTAF